MTSWSVKRIRYFYPPRLTANLRQIDNLGFGADRRRVLNKQVLAETLGFR